MNAKNIEAIEKNINSTMGRAKLAGLGFGIVQDGELVYAKGLGKANVEEEIPVTTETVFRIASISKSVTAVGVMKLWEEGHFQLDTPVNELLTSYQIRPRSPNDPPVTVKHLLTHTSGLGEAAPIRSYLHPDTFFSMGLIGRAPVSLGRFYGRSLRPSSPPGAKYYYANHGFATLGQIIADVSGQTFADYMLENLFLPLGMEKTGLFCDGRASPEIWLEGYRKKDGGHARALLNVDITTQADGSLFTTVNDFGKWVIGLLEHKVLKPETCDLMWRPHFQLDARLPAVGLGFFYEDWQGERIVAHDGAWLGFNTSMWLAPDRKLGVFAFTNTNSSAVISLAKNTMRGLVGAQRPTAIIPGDLNETPELWPELFGRYRPAPGFNSNLRLWLSYGGQLTAFEKEDKLALRGRWWGPWKKGVRLSRLDPNDPLAFHVGGTPIVFKRNKQGEVDRFHMKYYTFYKV